MRIIHTIAEMCEWRKSLRQKPATISFVPTMGALHDGHISLIREARRRAGSAGIVASSIFVNPTQFGPAEDFAKYPRTFEADTRGLQDADCDLVFVPTAAEMYGVQFPANAATAIAIDPGPLAEVLEGAIRPGHFRGVCTVVLKLFNIVQPTECLLGQKDFQQQAIVRRMCEDLNVPVEIVTCETMRELDGLAMSSRNRYLSTDERQRAPAIHEALIAAKNRYIQGERSGGVLEAVVREKITQRQIICDYAVAANPVGLQPWKEQPDGKIAGPCVLLVAAKLGATRLIDNLLLPTI